MKLSFERHYAECRDYLNVMLVVIKLNVVLLSFVMLSVVMLNVLTLSFVMLTVVMLGVVSPCR